MELAQLLPATILGLKKAWEWARENELDQEVKNVGESLVNWIKNLFNRNQDAQESLEELAKSPDNEQVQEDLVGALKTILRKNPEQRKRLEEILLKMENASSKLGNQSFQASQLHTGVGDNVGRDKIEKRKVKMGDKSQYIEKNDGTINVS